jgi:GntR family transcriptional regulator of arabinose operon
MKTKYSIVKDSIKSKILDGTYQPNQKISSESELMKEFGVSRHTVRLAIGDLVMKGWLYREQGSGTFCADRTESEGQMNGANSKNIAIITTYISDYIFPSIIRGAEKYLSKNGYNVSLFSTDNNHETEKNVLETILSQNFDGVIVEPTKSAISNPNINYYLNLENQKTPYIMINSYYDELEPTSIILDDEKGGYLQTEHLIKLGHKNIVGFFKTDDNQGAKRMKGYLKAHRDNDVTIIPNNIITYKTDEKSTKPLTEFESILSTKNGEWPTGVICYNDELAVKLLDITRDRQLKVPEDISIIGFDDSFLANVSEVKLTTIEHPQSKLGESAAKLILDLIDSHKGEQKKDHNKVESVVFEPKLIVRNSTKKI